jgi:hypothetical protein
MMFPQWHPGLPTGLWLPNFLCRLEMDVLEAPDGVCVVDESSAAVHVSVDTPVMYDDNLSSQDDLLMA